MPQEAVSADWRVPRSWSWIGGVGGRNFICHAVFLKASVHVLGQ